MICELLALTTKPWTPVTTRQVYEKCWKRDTHRLEGLEFYSSALWHLRREVRTAGGLARLRTTRDHLMVRPYIKHHLMVRPYCRSNTPNIIEVRSSLFTKTRYKMQRVWER